MKIQSMFVKDIGRKIDPVVVVGDETESALEQELKEYVMTAELQRHFSDFFSHYKSGINGSATEVGVWISGFFGSGKSHFLKMLALLLDGNRTVRGKKVLDYFIEDNKIADKIVLGDIRLAQSVPTDVILFDIDSKSDMTTKESGTGLVNVFLKVFNEQLGYYGAMPVIADLERKLDKENRLDEFKTLYEKKAGVPWVEDRHDFDFAQDTLVETLVDMGYMSEAAARNLCEKAIQPYAISIEDFAKLVKEYIDRKGGNHHVCFLVDEVGQYIGENDGLMLNLQTIRHEFGKECKGKAWLICTGQQDIDSVVHIKGEDFSKIMGRFHKMNLTASNVDEILKKRILEKNDTAKETLGVVYDQEKTNMECNIFRFTGTPEMKLYKSREDFCEVYPLVPYQFDLAAKVLTAIRLTSSSGKHLSDQARKMIELTQKATKAIMDKQEGALVPFNLFYETIQPDLDAVHSEIISKAMQNSHINPTGAAYCFPVEVLKVLFMIKHVESITKAATIENITTLMISRVDEDRLTLQKQVSDALDILVKETLVQKNGTVYTFLTNEEQEIGRLISKQEVSQSEAIQRAADIIYSAIYTEPKYKLPLFGGRYTFAFSRRVDDVDYKTALGSELGVRIITPYNGDSESEERLLIMSGQSREVFLVLPNDRTFYVEIEEAEKIHKFLTLHSSYGKMEQFSTIITNKNKEMTTHNAAAKLALEDGLRQAALYVAGKKIVTAAKDPSSRINEALGKLVESVFYKLNYIDRAFAEADVEKCIADSAAAAVTLEGTAEDNSKAQAEVQHYIEEIAGDHSKASMKMVKDRFMKSPYGFVDDDVEWLVARLFRRGIVSMTISSQPLTLENKKPDELAKYLTKKEYVDKLMLTVKQHPEAKWIKSAQTVMKELFGFTNPTADEDSLMAAFRKNASNRLAELNNMLTYVYANAKYPGKRIVEDGVHLLSPVGAWDDPMEFYKKVYQNEQDFVDHGQDYAQVRNFMDGSQKKIFDDCRKTLSIYENSKSFISDAKIAETAHKMLQLMSRDSFDTIAKLPALRADFNEAYTGLLHETVEPIKSAIRAQMALAMNRISGKPYEAQLKPHFTEAYDELLRKADAENNLMVLHSYSQQAKAIRERQIAECDQMDGPIETIKQNLKTVLSRMEGRPYEAQFKADAEQFFGNLLQTAQAAASAAAAQQTADTSGTKMKEIIRQCDSLDAQGRKKPKTVFAKDLIKAGQKVKTKADIDALVEEIRRELEAALDENTNELNIQ